MEGETVGRERGTVSLGALFGRLRAVLNRPKREQGEGRVAESCAAWAYGTRPLTRTPKLAHTVLHSFSSFSCPMGLDFRHRTSEKSE